MYSNNSDFLTFSSRLHCLKDYIFMYFFYCIIVKYLVDDFFFFLNFDNFKKLKLEREVTELLKCAYLLRIMVHLKLV